MGAGFKYKRAKSNDIQLQENLMNDNFGTPIDFLKGMILGFFGLAKFLILIILSVGISLAIYLWLVAK